MDIITKLLESKIILGLFIFCVLIGIYLVVLIIRFDKPIKGIEDDTADDMLDLPPEEFPGIGSQAPAVKPAAIQPKITPHVEASPFSGKIDALESSMKQLSVKVDELLKKSAVNQTLPLPKQAAEVLESLPVRIEQLKRSIETPKVSGPPIESPLLKEVAAGILSLQKEWGEKGKGGGVPQELMQKLDAFSGLKSIADTFGPAVQKLQSMNTQLDHITASLNKVSDIQATGSTGLPPETLSMFKNLLLNIDALRSQLESQKPLPGMPSPDIKPMFELFTKQMEDFQGTLHELKRSIIAGTGMKGALPEGFVQEIGNLVHAVQELRASFNASLNTEEELLSKIATKLDIIHQVLSAQRIAGGDSNVAGGSGGDKDIF